MKKIFTFIAAALFAVNASSQKAVSWMVQDAPKQATPFSVKDGDTDVLQIAFGTMDPKKGDTDWTTGSGKYTITYNDVEYSFDPYATTGATNGSDKADLAADGSSTGNYVAFVPKFDGKLIIGVQNNGGKDTYLFEDGVQKAATLIGEGSANVAFNGKEDIKTLNGGANYSGGILVDVTAGKLYTISVSGSKGRWSGVIFDYNPGADEPATPEVPYILSEVETGVFAVKMTQDEIAAAFDAAWVTPMGTDGILLPAGTVMAETEEVTITAAAETPIFTNMNKSKGKDMQKDFPDYNGFVNLGSGLKNQHWIKGDIVVLDVPSIAKGWQGIVSVTPKTDGVLKFGVYIGDNTRVIGIYRLTTMEEQDAGDLGGLVAFNNFCHSDPETDGYYDNGIYNGTEYVSKDENPEGIKGAAAYVEGPVKAGNTYLLLGGGSSNFTMHQISFVAGNGETGISSAIKDNAVENNVMYNLAGQRIAAPVSGQIYIVNGKKYIAK